MKQPNSPTILRQICLGTFFCVALALPAAAADNVWSVEFLNSKKGEWDQLAGAALHIEGRVSLSGRGHMKLAKCEVQFIVGDLATRTLSKGCVELTGRFKRDNGKLIFDVERIDPLPSDVDQYESRVTRFRNPKSDDWYALGDWASDRSRFYDDAELARKAMSAYDHGVTAAWRSLTADDAKGRFELADKVTRYKLSDARRQELMHEGYRVLWTAALKSKSTDAETWKQLAAQLANDLPGCKRVLEKVPDDLRERYEREPLLTYREASDEIRQQLHRMFYAAVLLKPIQDEAAPDGSNADLIADRIDQQVPEAKSLSDQYRLQKLYWRLKRAATATRGEIEQLAAEFRARRQPEQARQAAIDWLQAREPRLREDGVLGLLQLGDDYLALLNDEVRASRFLMEAHKLDPALKDVATRLNSLGYTLVGGTWVKGAPPRPDAMALATPELPAGGIVIGMTATQLATSMGGRPASLTRVVTKQAVTEVWCYLPFGASRLIVRLERPSTAVESTVVDFHNER